MKISNEPTPYLLLKAGTDSAWDCCDFAIVYLSKKKKKKKSGDRHSPAGWKPSSHSRMTSVSSL